MLEVGGENSGGGGEGGGAASFSFRANPQCSIGLRYKHPLEWTCSWDSASRQATVKRPTGSSISFRAAAGSADAPVSGGSRKLNYRVRLLNQDKSPCTDGNPIYLDMVQSNGSTLRFSASTGKVVSLISSAGVETTAEARLPNSRSTAIPPPAPSRASGPSRRVFSRQCLRATNSPWSGTPPPR